VKKIAIIQARMGSTRLPGKIQADLLGEPMLYRVVTRVQRARSLDDVVVATTVEPGDDGVVAMAERYGWQVFRGSQDDVLDRYYGAAGRFDADVVVRITSDCPLIDPGHVDEVVGTFLERQDELDYLCNFYERRTYPRGLDTEVFHAAALERTWREARTTACREHVTLYMREPASGFRCAGVFHAEDLSALRWTVDTAEDLALVRWVYESFGCDDFTWRDVLDLVERHPDEAAVNAHVQQKTE